MHGPSRMSPLVSNPPPPGPFASGTSTDSPRRAGSSRAICAMPPVTSPGGEKLTGILRSKPFIIPEKLSFFMAGHDGSPDKPPRKKNLVRLRDARTQEVLARSAPPRNDTAQPFSWDLSKFAGRKGYLE